MIEDVYANRTEHVVKSMTTNSPSLRDLLTLESILRKSISHATRSKMYAYCSDKQGASIALPKDVFSFILTDVIVRRALEKGKLDRVCLYLTYDDSVTMKMYPKAKSVSSCEVLGPDVSVSAVPNLSKYKRKRCDMEQEATEDSSVETMAEKMNKLENKCFFTFVPLTLHICCTIDTTQGLTINSPIIALLTKDDRAEDIIVALTRTSNPDTLVVANDILSTKFEPIAREVKELLRLANTTQKKIGWL